MHFKKNIEKLWFRAITGQISPEEKERLDRWLRESQENQNINDKVMKSWKTSSEPNNLFQADIDHEWNRFEKTVIKRKFSYQKKWSIQTTPFNIKQLQKRWRPIYVGSVVLIIILSVLIWKTEFLKSPYQTILAQNGQIIEKILSDGTLVHLNAGSKLEFRKKFFERERHVKLTGEAYFHVTPNAKSFIVLTNHAQTTVLGTEFNVWSRGEETRVIVKEGIVQLSLKDSDQDHVQIKAGHMSRVIMQQKPEQPIPVNSDHLLGWLEGRLVFEKTPLKEAIPEIERYYNVSIQLDENLKERLLTAQFKDQSIDNVLKKICLAFNSEYQFESGFYTIQSNIE